MKATAVIFGALFAVTLTLPALAGQPEVPSEPITMRLTNKPVLFRHDQHADLACVDCHHLVAGAANYQPCATAGCHDVLEQRSRRSVNSYYRIAHERFIETGNSCLSCHYEVVDANRDLRKALLACSGSSCHP